MYFILHTHTPSPFYLSFTLSHVKTNPLTSVTNTTTSIGAHTQTHTRFPLLPLEASRGSRPSRLQNHTPCACVRRPQTTMRRCAPSGHRSVVEGPGEPEAMLGGWRRRASAFSERFESPVMARSRLFKCIVVGSEP